MTKWQTPVTDRSADDIANRRSKAFLNVVDWLRICGNTELAATLARMMLGADPDVACQDAPGVASFPTAAGVNALVGNINTLALIAGSPGLVILPADYSGGSGGIAPDYEDVNAWEESLDLTRVAVVGAADYQTFCGVANAGQARHWQARYHPPFTYAEPGTTWKRTPRAGNGAATGSGRTRQNLFRRYAA